MFSLLKSSFSPNPLGTQKQEFGHSELIRNIGAALVLLMLITAIISAYTLREGAIKEWSKQLENLTLVIADSTEQILNSGESALNRLEIETARPILLNTHNSSDLSNTIEKFTKTNSLVEVAFIFDEKRLLIEATGKFSASEITKLAQGVQVAHQKNRSKKILFTPIKQNNSNTAPILFLSQTIQNPRGEFIGIVAIGLPANLFSKIYERLIADEPRFMMLAGLYSFDGQLISSAQTTELNSKDDVPIKFTGDHKEREFNLFSESKFVNADDEKKENFLIANRRISAYPFYVRLQIPENLYLSNWISNVRWIWITASLSLALVIIFEILLLRANRKTNQELIGRIHAQQELKIAHDQLENKIQERTQELTKEIKIRKFAQEELVLVNTQIAEVSHRAGMAQVANSVLHNIGNVLNSLNVSISTIKGQIKESPLSSLSQISSLLETNKENLAAFLVHDKKGSQLPKLMQLISKQWAVENESLSSEIDYLRASVQHINEIINKQQSLSGQVGLKELINVKDLIYSALAFHHSAYERSKIEIDVQVSENLIWSGDRNKLMQILLNLIVNAEESLTSAHQANSKILISAQTNPENRQLEIMVHDNGVGIEPENLQKLFRYGFTTKPYGHGFGLHASALAAQEMGGSLTAHSKGKGHGAVFTLMII